MQAGALPSCAYKHAMRKVHSDHARPISAVQRNGQIASSTTKIEYASLPVEKNRPKKPCSAGAPEAIELQRQEMVQQVVAWRNLCKHLPHFFRSIGFGNGALRARSFHRRGGLSLRHGALAKACCSR